MVKRKMKRDFNNSAFALDLETIPDMTKKKFLPEPKADSRLKDPEKIEAAKKEAQAKQLEKMGLSPFTGRICAFAVANDCGSDFGFIKAATDVEEKRLILNIAEYICPKVDTTPEIVTYNGFQFDFPYLYFRACALGMKPFFFPLEYWTKKYSFRPHFDLRMALTVWDDKASGSLDYFGKMLLKTEKEELNYSEFADMIKNGQGKKIALNCLQHTQLTFDLYKKVKPYMLFNSSGKKPSSNNNNNY